MDKILWMLFVCILAALAWAFAVDARAAKPSPAGILKLDCDCQCVEADYNLT